MANGAHQPPLTEPVIVPCLFCTGMEVEVTADFVRIVGYVELPALGMDQPERRIISRVVMPNEIARELIRDMRKALAGGGH